jgi:hypothetical protein
MRGKFASRRGTRASDLRPFDSAASTMRRAARGAEPFFQPVSRRPGVRYGPRKTRPPRRVAMPRADPARTSALTPRRISGGPVSSVVTVHICASDPPAQLSRTEPGSGIPQARMTRDATRRV